MEEKELAVVTSIDGCMDFLESLEQIREQLLHFTSDSTVNIDALKARLVWLGYERVGQVEMPGSVFHSWRYCRYLLPDRGESLEN